MKFIGEGEGEKDRDWEVKNGMWKKHRVTTIGMNMFPKRGSVEEQRLEYKIFTLEFSVYIIKMEEW